MLQFEIYFSKKVVCLFGITLLNEMSVRKYRIIIFRDNSIAYLAN